MMAANKRRKVDRNIESFLTEKKKRRETFGQIRNSCKDLRLADLEVNGCNGEIEGLEGEDVATWLVAKFGFTAVKKAVDYFQKLPKSLRENEVLRSRMLGVGDMTDIMNTIIMIAENHSSSLLHPELDRESTTSTTPGEHILLVMY